MELPQDPELQAGLARRRAVLGDTYVQGALDKAKGRRIMRQCPFP